MAEIGIGNLYDWNKNRVTLLPEISISKKNEGIKNIKVFMASMDSTYYMLLCRELNDYTIFKGNHTPEGNEYNAKVMIDEIMPSRGILKEIAQDKYNNSFEIWVTERGIENPESHMYLLFPCDDYVIDEL